MWNAQKSVLLSSICTKLVIFLEILFAIAAPRLVAIYLFYTRKADSIAVPLLVTIYTCCIPAMAALLSLDRLLYNIKKNIVFASQNVFLLRVISWCCFIVSFILFISGFYYILFVFVGIVAAFFGLILRVVKNIIEQAIQLKQENDFTI